MYLFDYERGSDLLHSHSRIKESPLLERSPIVLGNLVNPPCLLPIE